MRMPPTPQNIDDAARLWRESSKVAALTGAGISVASGIPDFRSPGGVWTKFDPDKVATARAMANNPAGVWEFLLELGRMMEKAKPNPAHQAMATLQQAGKLGGIVTQNIDGLHQAAGADQVVEFHGHVRSYFCNTCGALQDFSQARALLAAPKPQIPWLCGECGGTIRPAVVFFDEPIPRAAWDDALEVLAGVDLLVVAGTSAQVAPASQLPLQVKRAGGRLLEINPEPTALSHASDLTLTDKAERALPALAQRILAA